MFHNKDNAIHGTTVICVKSEKTVVMACDGQVTRGQTVIKSSANKIRTLLDGKVLVGFAGTVSDALTLVDKLQGIIAEHNNIKRACYELARLWRTDKIMRNFETELIIADKDNIFLLTGDGNIIDPETNVIAIGSGGLYAFSAATALIENTQLPTEDIVRKSMSIAAKLCIHTNSHLTLEKINF